MEHVPGGDTLRGETQQFAVEIWDRGRGREMKTEEEIKVEMSETFFSEEEKRNEE